MIFVDTGAWFALMVPNDPDHKAARAWLDQNREPLLTTDYVFDESMTLLKSRRERERAFSMGAEILDGAICRLEYLTPADIRATWEVFQHYRDKDWSFTDTTSRVVMERFAITTAFAFDDHFRQFGTVRVVP